MSKWCRLQRRISASPVSGPRGQPEEVSANSVQFRELTSSSPFSQNRDSLGGRQQEKKKNASRFLSFFGVAIFGCRRRLSFSACSHESGYYARLVLGTRPFRAPRKEQKKREYSKWGGVGRRGKETPRGEKYKRGGLHLKETRHRERSRNFIYEDSAAALSSVVYLLDSSASFSSSPHLPLFSLSSFPSLDVALPFFSMPAFLLDSLPS